MALASRDTSNEAHVLAQDDLLALAGYNLKRAYIRTRNDFKTALEDTGLSPRTFSVLSIVTANPRITQSDTARLLGIERSGMVVIVDELEKRGLLLRKPVPEDRRAYALDVTRAGAALYRVALERVREHEDRVFGALDDAERETLMALLRRVHEAGS